jgi:putative membrane protein
MRIRLVVVLALLGLLVGASGLVSADVADGDGMHHGDWGHMWDWWGVPFMGFWMIIIFVVQVVLAVLVYGDAEARRMNGVLWAILVALPWIGLLFLLVYAVVRNEKPQGIAAHNSAVAMLDERYANGEISRDEYLVKRKDIERRG